MSKMQSLYELEFKLGFVKAAASRTVRLGECPLRQLRLYMYVYIVVKLISNLHLAYDYHAKFVR